MSDLRAWLNDSAGEFNGVEPFAPRRVVLAWYGLLVVELIAVVALVWNGLR